MATGVGVFLMLAPIAVALAAVIFVLVVWRTRYVSLGSILAAVSIPLFLLIQHAFIRPVESLRADDERGNCGSSADCVCAPGKYSQVDGRKRE